MNPYESFSSLLSDPSNDNQQKFYDIITKYSEQKISQDEARAQISPLLKKPEWFAVIDPIVTNQLPSTMLGIPVAAAHPDPLKGDLNKTMTRNKSRRWTTEEDHLLTTAIQEHGTTNWPAVAAYVGNGRTRAQCSQRWNRVLNPAINKNNWTKEEEDKLMQCVAQFGNKAWTRVAQQLGGRCDVQCRFKYNYIMKKNPQQADIEHLPPPVQVDAPHQGFELDGSNMALETPVKSNDEMKME